MIIQASLCRIFLFLCSVILRYEARRSAASRWFAGLATPSPAILIPAAHFLSVLSPQAKQPSGLINMAYVGGVILALGILTLGIGLLRRRKVEAFPPDHWVGAGISLGAGVLWPATTPSWLSSWAW